jgi:hypothetical protein
MNPAQQVLSLNLTQGVTMKTFISIALALSAALASANASAQSVGGFMGNAQQEIGGRTFEPSGIGGADRAEFVQRSDGPAERPTGGGGGGGGSPKAR